MVSYANWHVQALVRLDQSRAEPALIDLLKVPEYELDAGWALVAIAKEPADKRPIVAGRFGVPTRDFRKLRTASPEWSTVFHESRRVTYADAIRERLLEVLQESAGGKTGAYQYRLKELAKVLATLDPQRSANLILEVAALPGAFDGWSRVDLLEALFFGGVVLAADHVMSILEPVIAEFRTHGIYGDGAALLRRLLCLLSFVEPAARGIARIRALLLELRLPLYDQRDLLTALGQSASADGLALLRDLARENPAGFQHSARDWIEAVAACPLPGARSLLVSLIDPEVSDAVAGLSVPDDAADLLAARLSNLAQVDRDLSERVLRLSSQTVSPERRTILAKIIARLDAPQALVAGLTLIDDSSPEPIPYDLWKAIEDVFLERRPCEEYPQSYTLAPRAANDVKKRLFEMAENDPRRTRSAYNLLGQIEEWRLEYGRPSTEPRHPAYQSGAAWPPLIP